MKKAQYEKYFKDKTVTAMSIGLLGRGVGDIHFMASCGANIIATDLKSELELKKSLRKLKKFKNIDYTLDRHLVGDFRNRDFILKGNGIPLENKYIEAAENDKVEVYMSFALLLEIIKKEKIDVTVIAVTGTKGKSTTMALLESILDESGKSYHVAGNVRGIANLPLLKKIKDGDIILAELDSWQLQGLHKVKMSPDIALFTNFFEDHLNYYKGSMNDYFYDKSAIYKYQEPSDVLVYTNEARRSIAEYEKGSILSQKIAVSPSQIPEDYSLQIFGKHNEKNVALAIKGAELLNINEPSIRNGLEKFKGVEGRFEYIGNADKRIIFNDNNSTTPESTIASINALKNKYPEKNIVLVTGGTDKGFNYEKYSRFLQRNIGFSLLFSGTATDKIRLEFTPRFEKFIETMNMKTALNVAFDKSDEGDIIILSPASASFGVFKNEYDRGDQFVREIKKRQKKNHS